MFFDTHRKRYKRPPFRNYGITSLAYATKHKPKLLLVQLDWQERYLPRFDQLLFRTDGVFL